MQFFRRVSVWVFGEEGAVLTDPATQGLLLASAVLVTGSSLLSPLIADLSGVFGVSESRAGWLILSFTVTGAITLPVAGAFADQIGRKPVLVAGLLLFGSAGATIGVVTRFETAVALRAVQAVGYASASPITLTLIGDLYQSSQEATVQGMRVSANSVMNTIVPLLAGVLFVSSWRYPFAVYLLAIPAAVWVWVAMPRVETQNESSLREYVSDIATFLSELRIGLLMVSFAARFFIFYGLLTYISILAVQEAGLAVVVVGSLLSIRGVVKTVSSTQVGRLAARFDPALIPLASFLLIAGGVIMMGSVPTPAMLAVGMVIYGTGDGVLAPSQKSLVTRLSPPEYRGGAMSTAATFQNVGKVIGPAVVAALLSAVGPATAFVLLGVLGGAVGCGSLFCVWAWSDL